MPDAGGYSAACRKLLDEGFQFDHRTCCYARGEDRIALQWNGRVYARRRRAPRRKEYVLMPVYTLVVTAADGHQHTTATEFPDDETAIAEMGVVTEAHPSVAVARGAGVDVQFLGAWDFTEGNARWTPEE